jgi:hypothetical protein
VNRPRKASHSTLINPANRFSFTGPSIDALHNGAGSIVPYLETNWFRPRVRAIHKTRPIPNRAKVLGQVFLAVRTDANSFWMLLSGNAEVAYLSSTTTIAAAANLSDTPATAAAISTVNIVAVATSVMATLTTTATSILSTGDTAATTATNAATPSAASDDASLSSGSASSQSIVPSIGAPLPARRSDICQIYRSEPGKHVHE